MYVWWRCSTYCGQDITSIRYHGDKWHNIETSMYGNRDTNWSHSHPLHHHELIHDTNWSHSHPLCHHGLIRDTNWSHSHPLCHHGLIHATNWSQSPALYRTESGWLWLQLVSRISPWWHQWHLTGATVTRFSTDDIALCSKERRVV